MAERVIDTMALAVEAFLYCRLGSRHAGPTLKLLVQALDGVDRTGDLEVEVSSSALASITPVISQMTVDPLAPRQRVRDLPPEPQRIFRLIKSSVIELDLVCSSNPTQKVLRSVGYALHVFPELGPPRRLRRESIPWIQFPREIVEPIISKLVDHVVWNRTRETNSLETGNR